jgi:hypothetical protein
MPEGARVESVDALRSFRAALVKFAEAANVALGDAESELQRTLVWLETEQDTYWQHQARKWAEAVEAAKDKVRQKKLFKDSSGRFPSAIDEEKHLAVCIRRLEEAQQKLTNTRKWARRLQREIHNYKGGVSALSTNVAHDIPVAIARLDRMGGILDAYVSLTARGGTAEPAAAPVGVGEGAGDAGSMSRGDTAPAEAQEAEDLSGAEDLSRLPGFPAAGPGQAVLVLRDAPAATPEDRFRLFNSVQDAEDYARENAPPEGGGRWAVCDAAGRVVARHPAGV